MNREIKFRGQDDSGEWCYGFFFENEGFCKILVKEPNPFQPESFPVIVKSETVGQYTGQHDNNGKEIWEGDILSEKWLCVVYVDKNTGAFMVKFGVNPYINKPITLYKYLKLREKAGTPDICNIVIGNIFENPEKLKQ